MATKCKQLGNYVIEYINNQENWGVRMAGESEYISFHKFRKDGIIAIKRYQSYDKRR